MKTVFPGIVLRFAGLAMIFMILSSIMGCADKIDQPVDNDPIKPQDVYTRKKPANWRGKENTHLPQVVIYEGRKQNIVVTVPLKDPSPRHYIEKIAIYDKKNKKDLAVKVFSKHAGYFEAIFSLHPVPRGEHIMVYAKCNLHDLWMVPLSEAIKK